MVDWREEARRKLANSKLSAGEREEISRELAGYLEDLCSDASARGLDHSAAAQTGATQQAAAELHEDRHLGANLYRARKENNMNDRTKRFWLPGITVLFASAIALAVLQIAGFRPYIAAHFGGVNSFSPVMINFPWLCSLPILGALGAYWSRRAGSSRLVRATVGLFPALVWLAVFLVILPVAFAVGDIRGDAAFLPAFFGAVLSWVIIPGAALLIGVVPFLRSSNSSRPVNL